MKTRETTSAHALRRCLSVAVLTAGVVLLGVQPAAADPCMQDNYQAGIGSLKSLNCTSNDVRIAEVTEIVGLENIFLDEDGLPFCYSGSEISFNANFEVLLGAQARYDIGLYIAEGQTQARTAEPGLGCQAEIITPSNSAKWLDLDEEEVGQANDVCGDIAGFADTEWNPQIVNMTIDTICNPGEGNQLLLPNCTSWRQPGSNDLCLSIADAYPGSPSKCNCDDDRTIPVRVESPTLQIQKTANPTSFYEPGAAVTYTVSIHNPAVATAVTLIRLTEDDYWAETQGAERDVCWDNIEPLAGDPCYGKWGGALTSVCPDTELSPDETVYCQFVRSLAGNAGDVIKDEVAVYAENGGPLGPFYAHATVNVLNVGPNSSLLKEAEPLCAVVEYTVTVTNNSDFEGATLTALTDSDFGNITRDMDDDPPNLLIRETNCSVPQSLAEADPVGHADEYSCAFVADTCSFPHSNTVTGTVNDPEGVSADVYGTVNMSSVTLPKP